MTREEKTRAENAGSEIENSSRKRKRWRRIITYCLMGLVAFLALSWYWLHKKNAVVRLVERHNGEVVVSPFREGTPDWLKPIEEAIGPLPAFDRIQSVEIISPRLTDEELEVFEETPIMTNLLLSSPRISDQGIKHLRNQLGLATLTLNSDRITDEGLRHLAKLKYLSRLLLYSNEIDGYGLRHLTGWKEIVSASFYCPLLKDKHLKYVSKMPLKALGLGGTGITDQGLRHIREMPLTELGLEGTQITDKGLAHLHSMNTLRELSINGTSVTEEGIRRLKRALPNLELRDQELPVPPPRYTSEILLEEARKQRERRRKENEKH